MADEPKLEPPIRAAIDAINRGDGKGFVASFAKNGAVNDWGEMHNGPGEIRKWEASEQSGKGLKLRVTGVSRLGGEVLVLVEITSAEGEKSTGTYAFRLAGGKIANMEVG
jgi:hypothetical protein